MAAGMGWRRIAEKAGVADGCVSRLLFGSAGRPPSARVRPATAEKLLAVRVDLADAATVDATGTHRRIQALIAAGWSASQIGLRLGITPTNMHALLARDRVLTRTARAVRAVYDQMWDSPPPEDTWHTKAAATRARRYAADRGWVRAAAWDDDTIDDPNAHPHANDTADGVDVDELLVHNALAGRSVQLNRDERDEVARRILARGGSVAAISRVLRLDHTQAKRIVQRVQRNDAGHCDAPVTAVAQ